MLRRTRFFSRGLLGVLSCGIAVSCGSPPPPAPPPAPAPVATEKAPPPPDVTAVPRPDTLVVFARFSKPDATLKVVGEWTHLPIPGADVLADLIGVAGAGKVIDLSQPVDVAVAMGGDAHDPTPRIAVSAAVRSLEEARGFFTEKYKVSPGANGATRIEGLDDPDDECDLVPSVGGATTRLVCADGAATIEALGPWLSRSAPRDSYAQDLHVDVRFAPLRPIVQSFRGMLPMILSRVLDAGSGVQPVTQAIDALVGDVADLTNDLDNLTLDLSLSDPGADATLTASFAGTSATLTRIALAGAGKGDAPPVALWRVPVDADVVYATRGLDPKDLAHARELGQNVVLAALEKQGMPEADRKAVVDPVMRYLDLYAEPVVYAKGVDMPAIDKARAAVDAAKGDAAREAAEKALLEQLSGWSLVQTSEPAPKVAQIAKDVAAALTRPTLVKWAKGQTHGTPPPTAKIVALPKTSQLPEGSVHLELTAYEEGHASPAPGPTAAPPPPTGGKPAKPTTDREHAAAKKTPPKPRVLHALVVPDQGKSWIVFAASFDLALAKARAVLPGAPDTGTLAKRTDLGALRDAKGTSAGFVSARGLVAASPFRYVLGATHLPHGPIFAGLASTQAQGATPIVFSLRADGRAQGGAFVATAKVPRTAVEDIVKVAMTRKF
jgi:hypothetical protein